MEDQGGMDVKMEEDSMPQSREQPQLQHLDGLFSEASLLQAFDQQQERLRATFEDALNKRLPLHMDTGPTSGGAPRQVILPLQS